MSEPTQALQDGGAPSKTGRLRRSFSGRMDVLSSFAGYSRIGTEWRPIRAAPPQRFIQPEITFGDLYRDARALEKKGLLAEVGRYVFKITPAGIAEWDRLWPESPARCEGAQSPRKSAP